jgi:hypothetical protein
MDHQQLLIQIKQQIMFLEGIQKVCAAEIDKINDAHQRETHKYNKITAELDALEKLRVCYEPRRTN